MPEASFSPGDIIIMGGETYQVIEDHGERGIILPFPVVEGIESEAIDWGDTKSQCRKIGSAQLPAPSPCATSGGCPTEGRLDLPATAPDPNLIAKA